jgi:hypothetical protein
MDEAIRAKGITESHLNGRPGSPRPTGVPPDADTNARTDRMTDDQMRRATGRAVGERLGDSLRTPASDELRASADA